MEAPGKQDHGILHRCPGCSKTFSDVFKHFRSHPICKAAYSAKDDSHLKQASLGAGMDARTAIFQAGMKQKVTDELGRMRYESLVSGSTVQQLKGQMREWLQDTTDHINQELQLCGTNSGVDIAKMLHSSLEWFKGIETEASEAAHHRSLLGRTLISPVERRLGSHKVSVKDAEGQEYTSRLVKDYCYDIPLVQQIQALMEYDPAAWDQILASSEAWSQDDVRPSPDVIADIPDGKLFIEHPKLGLKSGSIYCELANRKRLKLAFMAYYDEVETVNPIGVARGVHSIGCCYVKLINLPPHMRDRLEYIFPVTLTLNSDVKRYGPEIVIAGAQVDDATGVVLDLDAAPYSLGGQMRQLDRGVDFSVPTADAFGGYEKRCAHGWMVLFCADFPAAGKMLPTSQSASATKPCRGCDWEPKDKKAEMPASLLHVHGKWRRRTYKQASASSMCMHDVSSPYSYACSYHVLLMCRWQGKLRQP